MEKGRVIITGGTGFIGKPLARRLAELGHEVVILSRDPAHHAVPPGTRVEWWDGQTAERWGGLVDGAQALINLAGANIAGRRWDERYKELLKESRLNAGRAIVAAVRAVQHKPRAVVQASAVGYYGSSGDELLTEDSPPGEGFLPELVVAWEGSTAPVEALGVRRLVLRFGVVLAGDGGMLARLIPGFRLFLGGPLGKGRQWLSFIHRADLIEGLISLMESDGAVGPFNMTAPEPVRMWDFARALGRALGRPAWLPVPALLLRLVLGEGASFLLQGQRVLPKRLREFGYSFKYPDIRKSLEEIFKVA